MHPALVDMHTNCLFAFNFECRSLQQPRYPQLYFSIANSLILYICSQIFVNYPLTSAQGVDATGGVALDPVLENSSMTTFVLNLGGGPRVQGSSQEYQKPLAVLLVHLRTANALTLRHMREQFFALERKVCGFVARPGFVGKDHDLALQISEPMAWHGRSAGEYSGKVSGASRWIQGLLDLGVVAFRGWWVYGWWV